MPDSSQTGASEQAAPVCYRHTGREAYIRCQRCDRPICPDCMRTAAVGFQCPNCVKEGAKSTRSHQGRFGGRPSGNPAATSMALIGVNAVVFLLVAVTGGAVSRLVDLLALLPVGRCESTLHAGGFYPNAGQAACSTIPHTAWAPGVSDGAYYQLLTSMFTHVEIWHIGFNMVALWVLGPQLEAVLGRVRFLAVYLLSGLAGSALVYWLSDPHSSTVGASGALFGLMGALLVLVVKSRGPVNQILMWIGLNFVFTVLGRGSISWQGHVGGFVGGVLLTLMLIYVPRKRRTLWQGLGAGAFTLLLVVAVLARTAALA
jgi:membrane associated rhomboid family serine protease